MVVERHPEVIGCLVVAVEDPDLGQRVTAVAPVLGQAPSSRARNRSGAHVPKGKATELA